MSSFHLYQLGALCFISMTVADLATTPFLPNVPGQKWVRVGYLDMTDPAQKCPDSWQKFSSPRASCGKKNDAYCNSVYVNITTYGFSYQQVCGRLRGYQVGSPDAFGAGLGRDIDRHYVDGVSITYGSPGNRHHVYTYAAGVSETAENKCPCAGGASPPDFIGFDYYCESGNPISTWGSTQFYYADVLWDGQQCGGLEGTCCNPPNLPWFCKTFPTPISEDLEVRICMDQGTNDENLALEFFELYIQATYITGPTLGSIIVALLICTCTPCACLVVVAVWVYYSRRISAAKRCTAPGCNRLKYAQKYLFCCGTICIQGILGSKPGMTLGGGAVRSSSYASNLADICTAPGCYRMKYKQRYNFCSGTICSQDIPGVRCAF